jgi:hypothetical protein
VSTVWPPNHECALRVCDDKAMTEEDKGRDGHVVREVDLPGLPRDKSGLCLSSLPSDTPHSTHPHPARRRR